MRHHTRSCSALNCGSKKYAGSEFKLHRFPLDVERCRVWVKRAKNPKLWKMPIEVVHNRAYLCEKHFPASQYMCLKRGKLIPRAIPSIFPADVESNSPVASSSVSVPPIASEVVPISCSSPTQTDVCSLTQSPEMKFCRLCAVLCKDTVSIFEQEGVALELAKKISMILPIAVSKTSKLPLVVCWDCINQLNATITFVNKCIHGQLQIERIFKSLAKINYDRQPLIYDESNFQVEGSKSISNPVSNQLLSREVTSKDESPRSENKNISDITTKDPSAEITENKKNKQSSSISQTKKDNEDENISSRTLQEINVAKQSDNENEDIEQISYQGDIHPLKNYCKECKVQYNTQQEFKHHRRQYHMMRYPCRFCPRTLILRKHLDLHESYHIFGKKHKCRRCPESYDTINELDKHRMSVHLDTPRYRCETCNKPYFQEHFYLQHVRLHSVVNRFLCEMCGKAFKTSSSLRAHRNMYCENPVEKKLPCEFCDLMFHHKSHLKVHVRMHTGEKPYLCSICGKGYRNGYTLKQHIDAHSISKHACSFCGQLFLRNHGLVSHLKRHASCNVCSKKFGKEIKQHLLHRREFHSAEMEEELENGFGGVKLVEFADGGGKIGDFSKTVVKCEKCTRNFASAFWLRSHQEGLCIDQPIFKCPICEKVTRRKDSYKSHMMSHSKNKIHQCSHCSQTFDIYQNLVKHEKEHKVAKPFSCSECGKGFGSSASLSKHLIAHSTGRVYSCKSCDEYFTSQLSLLIHKRQHNTESKRISPYSISLQKFSKPKLAQMCKIPHLEEQKQSTANTSIVAGICCPNQNYILNISEESYAGDTSLDNVAGEVLVYDSQSIESHFSEIVVVSDQMDGIVMGDSG